MSRITSHNIQKIMCSLEIIDKRASAAIKESASGAPFEPGIVRSLLTEMREALGAATDELIETREMIAAYLQAQEWNPACVIEAVNTLQLQEGDVLVVKLGDKNTGWIPSPGSEQRTVEVFSDAIAERGLADKVTLVVVHYGHELEVIRDATVKVRAKPELAFANLKKDE